MRPKYILIFGPPGAGKGTQGRRLAAKLGLAYIASGDLFRQHVAAGTELGRIAKDYMDRGLYVPDEVVVKMVLERLGWPDAERGAVLDGFPRTLPQAEALEKALAEWGAGVDLVFYIKISEAEAQRRIRGRWVCRNCQAAYNLETNPPQVPGRCDVCGGELYQRTDETPETLRRRFEVFHEQTVPVLEYYRARGLLVEVNGEQPIDTVFRELVAAADRVFGRIAGPGSGGV